MEHLKRDWPPTLFAICNWKEGYPSGTDYEEDGTGTVRIVSYLKLETRTDKTPTLAGKRL